ASRTRRPRGGVHWGRQRAAACGLDDLHADRRAARTDTARALPSVAGSAARCGDGRRRSAAVPALRSAPLYTRGLPVPDADHAGAGAGRRGARTDMNATTLSLSDAQTTPLLDRLTVALLLAFVATVQVSIVAAQALFILLLFAWIATLVRD